MKRLGWFDAVVDLEHRTTAEYGPITQAVIDCRPYVMGQPIPWLDVEESRELFHVAFRRRSRDGVTRYLAVRLDDDETGNVRAVFRTTRRNLEALRDTVVAGFSARERLEFDRQFPMDEIRGMDDISG